VGNRRAAQWNMGGRKKSGAIHTHEVINDLCDKVEEQKAQLQCSLAVLFWRRKPNGRRGGGREKETLRLLRGTTHKKKLERTNKRE